MGDSAYSEYITRQAALSMVVAARIMYGYPALSYNYIRGIPDHDGVMPRLFPAKRRGHTFELWRSRHVLAPIRVPGRVQEDYRAVNAVAGFGNTYAYVSHILWERR